MVLLAGLFGGMIRQWCAVYLLLCAEAPSPEVLSETVDRADEPAALLRQLWLTQRLPHRRFVLEYLGKSLAARPDLFHTLESVAQEATNDADIEAREQALALLERMKHPRLRTSALEQLSDPDPAVRVLGLQSLRSIAGAGDVATAFGLLTDPDPRVVVAGFSVLRRATGEDFGLRANLAPPIFLPMDSASSLPVPNLEAIRQGVQKWRLWWEAHRTAYPPPVGDLPRPHLPPGLATRSFSLDDVTGRSVSLTEYSGKVVLLLFWSLAVPASLEDLQVADALQRRHPDDLVVLAMCIPGVPTCHDHGDDHGEGHDEPAPGMKASEMRSLVRHEVSQRQISCPVLLDPDARISQRFNIGNVPACIILDPQGNLRRRLVGSRTETVLEALIQQAARGWESESDTPGIPAQL